jgi:hypothetical protein
VVDDRGPALVVLAAGVGTRYGGGKQVDRLGPSGERLFEYSVFDARRAGFARVVFVIRDALRAEFELLSASLPRDLDVRLVEQHIGGSGRTKPWGTTQAVLTARAEAGPVCAVVNADDFYGREAHALASRACARARETGVHALIGQRLDATLSDHGGVSRAIPRVERGRLCDLDEVRDVRRTADGITGRGRDEVRRLSPDEIASMNHWVFATPMMDELARVFDEFRRHADPAGEAECALPEAVGAIVRSGRAEVDVLQAPGPWLGLTHRDDRLKVMAGLRDMVSRDVYPSPLWGRHGV